MLPPILPRFLPVGDALDDDASNPFATGLFADTERCVCPPAGEAGSHAKPIEQGAREALSRNSRVLSRSISIS